MTEKNKDDDDDEEDDEETKKKGRRVPQKIALNEGPPRGGEQKQQEWQRD